MRFTKHHGLGNDFLVLLDDTGEVDISTDLVVTICDRHRGVGADGVLHATRHRYDDWVADAVMVLYNADGSRAEMSGNGVRCLAQALLLADWATPPEVVVATDAGFRTVEVQEQIDATTHLLTVDMGPVRIDGEAAERHLFRLGACQANEAESVSTWSGGTLRRAAWANMGNPHLVVEVDSASDVELVSLGEKVNATVPGGGNVHFVTPRPAPDGAELQVGTYERGVGPTLACGTGACASAAVAHRWGLVGTQVTVHMPGGQARVELGDTIRLTGPAVAVAAVDYPFPG